MMPPPPSPPPLPPAPPDAPPFLIAAASGRALAASAARGGYRTVVLDFFGDRDTRALATAVRTVARPRVLRFDRRALLAAERALRPDEGWAGLVPGSGFEARPDLLAEFGAGTPRYGNSPELIAAVKDPARFFPLLARLGFEHPEVRLGAPAKPAGWLQKRVGGAGGAHVRPASRRPAPARTYFQRVVDGAPHSATFLANGRRALLLGCNEQWTEATPRLPYRYGGAVSGVSLPAAVAQAIPGALDRLIASTGLVGLGSLDFVVSGGRWVVLEVNPRPTATIELYDPDYSGGLFAAHLRSCAGELPEHPAPAGAARAHAVVTAPCTGIVPGDLSFPEWARDLPMPGTALTEGAPLCTVVADADTPTGAAALIRERRAELLETVRQALDRAVRV